MVRRTGLVLAGVLQAQPVRCHGNDLFTMRRAWFPSLKVFETIGRMAELYADAPANGAGEAAMGDTDQILRPERESSRTSAEAGRTED